MTLNGDDLRNARKEIGLTQLEIADATDFSTRQIGRFENNENLSKVNKYFRLFTLLGLTREDLDKEE